MSNRRVDTSTREGVRVQGEQAKFVRDGEVLDIKHIMSDVSGRRFVWRLLSRCGVYRLSYTGNSDTYFREGERNIGLWLLAELARVDQGLFLQMQQENQKEGDINHA